MKKLILVVLSLFQCNLVCQNINIKENINKVDLIEIGETIAIEQSAYIETNQLKNYNNYFVDLSSKESSETNMINYDLSTKSLSFESFDPDLYCKRQPSSQTSTSGINNQSFLEEIDIETYITFYEDHNVSFSSEYIIDDNDTEPSDDETIDESDPNDNRQLIVNPKENGYLRTGKTVAKYYNILNNENNKWYTIISFGTGFMEGPNLMVTAAHCVYGDKTVDSYDDGLNNPRFPDKLEFYPGLNGSEELSYGANYQYYSEGLMVNINTDYFLNTNADSDWAAVELDRNIGTSTGWYGKISNYYSVGSNVLSNGYPGDKENTQWLSEGEILSKMNDFKIRTNVYGVGGQSGSAYHVAYNNSNYVAGILTHIHSSDNWETINGTSGVYFTNFIYHYLNSFVTHNGTGFTYTYEELNALNHIRVCQCGEETVEAHEFQPFKNGNRCKKCFYFTTGPVITPILGIVDEEIEEE